MADPILAPELRYCHLPIGLPDEETVFDCCAPNWDRPALDFQFNESAPYNLKVRPVAHSLDDEYAAKLSKAYALMKALPPEDPRSFAQQANIHCAYCSSTYQMGNSTTPLQVHASWLFFPFHRWYMYFHERILAKLIEDDTFGLPFWNYDHPDGMTIPSAYMNYSELQDDKREPSHLPPSIIMLDYYYMNASIRTAEEQIAANLATAHRMVVSGATTQYRFHGQPYRKDDAAEPGFGTVETMPHNSVHGWTGDSTQIGKKDMGTLYAAGRDPVFYTHHASLDRLWEVWRNIEGNEDIGDPDYLNSEFVFYNENAELIKVNVKDSFNTVKLGYVYEFAENLWLNLNITRLSDGVASISESTNLCLFGEEVLEVCSLTVSRDKANALEGEETIVIEGIEGRLDSPALFEVFVNLPEAALSTMLNCSEYAGRFSAMAQVLTNMTLDNSRSTSLRLGISHNVQDLDLGEEDSIVVTLVPLVENSYSAVSISSIRVEYETVGLGKNWSRSRGPKPSLSNKNRKFASE